MLSRKIFIYICILSNYYTSIHGMTAQQPAQSNSRKSITIHSNHQKNINNSTKKDSSCFACLRFCFGQKEINAQEFQPKKSAFITRPAGSEPCAKKTFQHNEI